MDEKRIAQLRILLKHFLAAKARAAVDPRAYGDEVDLRNALDDSVWRALPELLDAADKANRLQERVEHLEDRLAGMESIAESKEP